MLMMEGEWCPVCTGNGTNSRLKLFQINMQEAIKLCVLAECPYPAGSEKSITEIVVNRTLDEMSSQRDQHTTSQRESANDSFSSRAMSQPRHEFPRSHLMSPPKPNIDLATRQNNPVSLENGDFKPLGTETGMSEESCDVLPLEVDHLLSQQDTVLQRMSDVTSKQDTMSQQTNNLASQHTTSLAALPQHSDITSHRENIGFSCASMPPVQSVLPVDGATSFETMCERSSQSDTLVSCDSQSKTSRPGDPRSRKLSLEYSQSKTDNRSINRSGKLSPEDSQSKTLRPGDPQNETSCSGGSQNGKWSPGVPPCEVSCPGNPLGEHRFTDTFLQWTNKDALCWLDVCMNILVHSAAFCRFMAEGTLNKKLVLPKLHKAYRSAQDSLRQSLEFQHYTRLAEQGRLVTLQTSIGKVIVRTGGGGTQPAMSLSPMIKGKQSQVSSSGGNSREWVMTPTELSERASSLLTKARNILSGVRDLLWASLETRLRCVRGKNDSPVFALPLMLREHRLFQDYFKLKYYWQMDCSECGYQHIDEQEKNLPSFPSIPADFCMLSPHFLRGCFECDAPGQRMTMCYQHALPDVLLAHFVDGLRRRHLTDYDFCHQGAWYAVKAVVQYRNQPDHFVAWLRDLETNDWMQCDDLAGEICKFSASPPTFPPSQVHLVMWEKVECTNKFRPSTGCLELQRICAEFVPPVRKLQLTALKGSERLPNVSSHSKDTKPSASELMSLRSPFGQKTKTGPGLRASDVIEVLSSQTSSDAPDDTPKRVTKTFSPFSGRTGKHENSASKPTVELDEGYSGKIYRFGSNTGRGGVEEPVRGISLGGNDAVLVPGLKPLQQTTTPIREDGQNTVLHEGRGSGNLKHGSRGNTSAKCGSSLADRVNDNLRKILEEKKSGVVHCRPEVTTDSHVENRLQRMREKLLAAKQHQTKGAVSAVIPTENGAATDVKLGRGPNHPEKATKEKNASRHLSLPLPSQETGTKARKYDVLHSPTHQRSSVKELLRSIKGNQSRLSAGHSQSFEGYCPKVKTAVQPQVKRCVGAKKNTTPQRTKKISFGQDVQVKTMSAGIVPSKGLKRRVNLCDESASPPTPKKILVSPKSGLKSGKSNLPSWKTEVGVVGNRVEKKDNLKGVKWQQNLMSTSAGDFRSSIPQTMSNLLNAPLNHSVPYCNSRSSISQTINSSPTPLSNHSVPHSISNGLHLNLAERKAEIPHLSPCSLRGGQIRDGAEDPSGNAGMNGTGLLDDVIGELCATLDVPLHGDHTVALKPDEITPVSEKTHHKEHSILDANLPSVNLDDSDHFMSLDFDPSLFGDSPIKHDVF